MTHYLQSQIIVNINLVGVEVYFVTYLLELNMYITDKKCIFKYLLYFCYTVAGDLIELKR